MNLAGSLLRSNLQVTLAAVSEAVQFVSNRIPIRTEDGGHVKPTPCFAPEWHIYSLGIMRRSEVRPQRLHSASSGHPRQRPRETIKARCP